MKVWAVFLLSADHDGGVRTDLVAVYETESKAHAAYSSAEVGTRSQAEDLFDFTHIIEPIEVQ